MIAIEQWVAQRVAGLPGSTPRADLNGVALEVGGLFTRLSEDDTAIDASDAAAFAAIGRRTAALMATSSREGSHLDGPWH